MERNVEVLRLEEIEMKDLVLSQLNEENNEGNRLLRSVLYLSN